MFAALQAQAKPNIKRICAARNGINTVYWFPVPHSCSLVRLNIFARENEFSAFRNIYTGVGEHPTNSYAHTNASAFQSGAYYIEFVYDCSDGITYNIFSDTITVDVQPPAVMEPDSISVGPNGEIILGWSPSSAPDAKSYVIYRADGTVNKIVGQVDGRFSTTYTDSQNGDASSKAEKYKIAPTDSCDNIAAIGNFHQTMHLQISQDKCASEVYLKWSEYIGWSAGVERYDLYYSLDENLSYFKAGTTNQTQFTARLVPNNKKVYFFIRAVKSGNDKITSSSNRVNITTSFEDTTQRVYLSNVTHVKNTRQLNIEWNVDVNHNYLFFDVKRGKTPANLDNIARVNASVLTNYVYNDVNADSNFVWYYSIVGNSICGKTLGRSNLSNSINLRVNIGNGKNTLYWNAYNTWPANVESYEVYRVSTTKGNVNEELIAKLPNTGTTYDDVKEFDSDARPGICYYVVAVEADGNQYGFKERSFSNTVCYTVPPIVNVPNAFYPEGIYNKVFLPIALYADSTQSRFSIYNRWGEKIIESREIWKGWDGTIPGRSNAPEGVYFYRLEVIGIDKSYKVYSAPVTLVR